MCKSCSGILSCYDFCHRKLLFFLGSEGEPVLLDFPFGKDFVFGDLFSACGCMRVKYIYYTSKNVNYV